MSPTVRASTSSFPRRERGVRFMPESERSVDGHDETDEHYGDDERYELDDDEVAWVEPVEHPQTDAHDAAAIDQQIERAEGEGMVTEHAKISATDPGPDEVPPEDEPEPDRAPGPDDEEPDLEPG
jgi:hypothetical protein